MTAERRILRLIIAVLLVLGFGATAYKIETLGFSLSPNDRTTVWTVEGAISFSANGGPVEVRLNLPDQTEQKRVLRSGITSPGYDFRVEEKHGTKYAVWSSDQKSGDQKIFFKSDLAINKSASVKAKKQDVELEKLPQLPDQLKTAIDEFLSELNGDKDLPADKIKRAQIILDRLNAPELHPKAQTLLTLQPIDYQGLDLAVMVLRIAGLPTQVLRGLYLDQDNKNQSAITLLNVFDGEKWQLIDPNSLRLNDLNSFVALQKNKESLLEVEGGSDSKVRFSSISTNQPTNQIAIGDFLQPEKSVLLDFSIYSLPISTQNTFKLLLFIPLGALVVVIMRNLVGIKTSGTFLPILIALSFLQTSLLTGVALFLIVVACGLALRSTLSHLNLLLVPRISAVLVFVIVIYLMLAVISFKMGSDFGLNVTFFPMIIISWTIERMSVLWEEEGPKEVLTQGGGTLLSASLIYLALNNEFVAHMTYSFPELLLVVLAFILMIGSYTGYRLNELGRFEPMGRE